MKLHRDALLTKRQRRLFRQKIISPREKDELKHTVSRILATDDSHYNPLAEDLLAMLCSPHFHGLYLKHWAKWGKAWIVLRESVAAFERRLENIDIRYPVIDFISKDGKTFYYVSRTESFTLFNLMGGYGYDFTSQSPGFEKIKIFREIEVVMESERSDRLRILLSLMRIKPRYARRILTRALNHSYPFPNRPEKSGLLTDIRAWLDDKDIPPSSLLDP